MTTLMMEKVRQALRVAKTAGILNSDESGQIIKALSTATVDEESDEILTRPQLAARWRMTTRNIIKKEKRGIIQRLSLPGHPRYSLKHIKNVEIGNS